MRTCRQVVIGLTMAVAAIGMASQAQAKCVLAGGEGSGVTPEIATFMANAALKNSITKMGAKAKGKSRVTCKSDAIVVTVCKAQQRACK